MNGLTEKQKQFCDEYLIDFNATRAYKAVYKSCKKDTTANVNGCRLLSNAKIKAYIAERQKDLQKRTEITQEKVLQELASVAFANGADFARVVEKMGKTAIQNTEGEVVGYEETPYTDVEVLLTENIDKEKLKAISSIRQGKFGIEVKTADKIRALELIGKHIGMFKDKEDETEQLGKLDKVLEKIEGNI